MYTLLYVTRYSINKVSLFYMKHTQDKHYITLSSFRNKPDPPQASTAMENITDYQELEIQRNELSYTKLELVGHGEINQYEAITSGQETMSYDNIGDVQKETNDGQYGNAKDNVITCSEHYENI